MAAKSATKIATKSNPALWRRSVASAKRRMGTSKTSARLYQLATKLYKSSGGKYKGRKTSANSLSQWGRKTRPKRRSPRKKK